jgi:hypothetical protein
VIDLRDSVFAGSSTIYGGDGNDTIDGTNNPDLIFGGSGDDILIGHGGDDVMYGEEGNDSAQGGLGIDRFYGGDGSDVFTCIRCDGRDIIEGGGGESDVVIYIGNDFAETFTLTAVGTRVELFRNVNNIRMDIAGVEHIQVLLEGGDDTAIVNDLSATEVRLVSIGLGQGGIDSVTVNGRNVPDTIHVSQVGTAVAVTGLAYDVFIADAAAASDALIVNGNEGDDTLVVAEAVRGQIAVTLNGGAGDDFLTGDATLNGGDGNDILIGGAGDNVINGGPGDDLIDGRGGTNTIDGGTGADTILVSGTAGPDTIVTTHTAGVFTIAGGLSAGTNNITGMEAVRVEAGDGADSATLNLLAAGGLHYTVLGGNPVGAPGDTLTVNTPSDIAFTPGPENDAGSFVVATTTSTNISFDEIEATAVVGVGPGVDGTFNGTAGDDDITVQATSATSFTVAATGAVPVSYSGLATFIVDAKEGDDDVTVAPIAPGGAALTIPITIIGNSPTAATGDQLTVEGSAAGEIIAVDLTAGTVTVGAAAAITFTTTELLAISALGGNDTLAISGSASYEYTPALAPDAGTIQTTNLPIAFTGLFGGETITVTGIGAADSLVANGTPTNDLFNVAATSGNVVVNGRVTLSPSGIETLTLNGYDGDDTFTIGGPLPYTTTNIAAGGPRLLMWPTSRGMAPR